MDARQAPSRATAGWRAAAERAEPPAEDEASSVGRLTVAADLLLVNDFTRLAALVESFFASIPYEWYTNNDIASYEGFYASVSYSYSPGWSWTWWSRTAAATAGWTWRCVSTTTT